MPEFLENIVDFVKEKPMIAAGAVAGAVVIFVLVRGRGGATVEDSGTGEVGYGVNGSPLLSQYTGANVPVVWNTVPSLPAPGEQTNGGTNLITIQREGKAIQVTGGPPGLCPPGYVSAQQPGQPARCTLASDANKKPGQRTTFFPSRGESPYVN